jgi:hypothetical protein
VHVPVVPMQPALTKGTVKILNELCKALDETGEYLVYGLFVDKPDKKLFPDYYQYISNPIALKNMVAFLKKGKYATVEEVRRDMETLCANAGKYNQEGSVVHNVSLALRDDFFQRLDELQQQVQAAAEAGEGGGGEGGQPGLKKKRGSGRPFMEQAAGAVAPTASASSSSSSSSGLSLKMTLPSALFKSQQQRQMQASHYSEGGLGSLSSDAAPPDLHLPGGSSSRSSARPAKKVKMIL